jgi:ubiquinone/menaquinone biosynthesis C-methylase UbiE
VDFRLGEIESLPVADATVDVIISNCVLNLSPERDRVLAEALRVLKPGGRLVISDLVWDVPIAAQLREEGEAISACLPVEREAYLSQLRTAGFVDVEISEAVADSVSGAIIEGRRAD